MKSFQDFMEDAFQSLEGNQIDEVAGDAAAFKERQKAKQSAIISLGKSRAAKYKTHGVRGTDKKSRKKMAKRNKALAQAAFNIVKTIVTKGK